MGQNTSSNDSGLDTEVAQLQKKLSRQMDVLNRLVFLRHRQLVEIIEELNGIMKEFIDKNGKQLCFSIRKGTDSTIFWKTTIRIRCVKLNTVKRTVESSRVLTLRQFIVMYKEVKDKAAMLSILVDNMTLTPGRVLEQPDISKKEDLTASVIFPSDESGEEVSECCVCMDRKACIMLSCSHEFCETCIDNWTRDMEHSNCPICRSKVKGSDDTWVLPDKNQSGNFENEVKDYIVGLADQSGHDD